MRICLFSERLTPPYDEGIKNYALHLARALSGQHEVLTLTAFGQSDPARAVHNVSANPLLISLPLARRVRRFRPELLIYVPTACATLFSFLRARMLRVYASKAPVVLIALQARNYGRLARALMPRVCPDLLCVQSEATRATLTGLPCPVRRVPSGIDMERFRPVDVSRRQELRQRYGVDQGAYVVLHVGHLNRERNVQSLLRLQRPGYQVVVAGSTSTAQDARLIVELAEGGVLVIKEYVADIAELYQMADCYAFPARGETSAIDLPLSVLEAMACDLPVVTTRFGSLPELFAAAPGMRFVDAAEEMAAEVEACRGMGRAGTRALAEPFAWPRVAERLLDEVQRALHGDEGVAVHRPSEVAP